MKVRLTLIIVLALVVPGLIVFSQKKSAHEDITSGCGDVKEHLRLCIESTKSEYALDEPVNMRVILRNDSDQSTRLGIPDCNN